MSYPGPSKPIRIRQWEPTSPVARKRFRLDSSGPASGAATTMGSQGLPKDEAAGLQLATAPFSLYEGERSTSPWHVVPSNSASGLAASLAALETESHALRLARASKEQNDKSTGKTYMRHVNRYVRWWEAYQESQCEDTPSRTPIPAFPITASRAAVYLEYESSREKKVAGSKKLTIKSSTVGKEMISQMISALENWRFTHAHEYKDVPEAQVGLRSDFRIKTIEKSKKHDEPKRLENAQAIKAAGTSSDSYTEAELVRCAVHCLQNFSGTQQVYLGLRDWAQLAFTCSAAARGESSRILRWSDLFQSDIPMDDLRVGTRIPVLGALADNAKTNQQGRVDEHGVIRHRIPELCCVGALARLFFAHFHILKHSPPNFAPVFGKDGYGEYGYREWYECFIFAGKDDVKVKMSYDNHHSRVTSLHKDCGIDITKITHGGRGYAAKNTRANGATVQDTKALGGWNESGSFRACYDRAFPTGALLGAASFNARKPEEYHLPRGDLQPPADVLAYIFPWVEAEEALLEARTKMSSLNRDIALKQFFRVLRWFRTVIIQDCALLYNAYPACPLFRYAPFSSPSFRSFAATAAATISAAEENARLAFYNLPEHMARSMKGYAADLQIRQEVQYGDVLKRFEAIEAHNARLESLMASRGPKGNRKVAQVPPPPAYAPALLQPQTPTAPMINTFTPTALGPHNQPLDNSFQPFGPAPPLPISHHHIDTNRSFSHPATFPAAFALHPNQYAMNSVQPYPTSSTVAVPFVSTISSQSAATSEDATRAREWHALTQKLDETRMRKHEWEYKDEYIPIYRFETISRITDVWDEWSIGIHGQLPVRELTEVWGARWRRGDRGQGTESCRRMKVVALVNKLAAKRGWDVKLALRFLRETYECTYNARKFCDYLQKNGGTGADEVLNTAANFP